MHKLIVLGILSFFPVNTVLAQHEINFTDHLNVEGHIPDRERNTPERNTPGGNGGNSEGRRSSRGGSAAKPSTAATTINGKPIKVSPQAIARMQAFLNTYRNVGTVGHFVSSFAAIFQFLGLVTAPDAPTAIFDSEQAIIILTAPGTWAKVNKGQALAAVNQEIANAFLRKEYAEARMWQRVSDIIRNPGRYNNKEKVEFDSKTRSLKFLHFDEELREIPGYRLPQTDTDRQALDHMLGNLVRRHPETQINIRLMELIFHLEKPNGFPPISARDKMILNKTLIALPEESKPYWRNQFQLYGDAPGTSLRFWQSLITFLDRETWNEDTQHYTHAGEDDWDIIE
jgi:hypothetical protein